MKKDLPSQWLKPRLRPGSITETHKSHVVRASGTHQIIHIVKTVGHTPLVRLIGEPTVDPRDNSSASAMFSIRSAAVKDASVCSMTRMPRSAEP